MPLPRAARLAVRRWLLLAAALLLVALAVVPAVTIAAGQQDAPPQTVSICHFDPNSETYAPATTAATDFYGSGQPGAHGGDARDIVPPFTIQDPGREPSSFGGRNWGATGQAIYQSGCNEKKIVICHRDSNPEQPYGPGSQSVSVNSILGGNGHAGHTGPVYPEKGPDGKWGDIIPPFEYDGQVFEGLNWDEKGQAIHQNNCGVPHPPDPKPITPILECVEALGDGKFLAHFNASNPNTTTVEPTGDQNCFHARPNRTVASSTRFAPGEVPNAAHAEFTGGTLTWSLTGKDAVASSDSTRCRGSITVVKELVPADDRGRFNLEIDGVVAGGGAAVGDAGTTDTIPVTADVHRVSEAGARGTESQRLRHPDRVPPGRQSGCGKRTGPPSACRVGRNQAIVCTITNRRKEARTGPCPFLPVLECVVFNDSAPDIAVWGYQNRNDHPVTILDRSAEPVHPGSAG